MKFIKHALSIALISFTSVEARKTFSKQDFADAVAAGNVNEKLLFKNAIPYNEGGLRRRAEEAQQGQEGEEGDGENYQRVGVTSSYRLQFNSCLSMETQNYNLLLDNLVGYAKSGALKSVRNYVLFDVCNGDNCQQQTWMVDLLTFIEAVLAYGPERKESVCSACQTYGSEVCGKSYNYDYAEGEENDGEARRLNSDYVLFDADMCSQCETYQCWYDNEGDQEEDFDKIEEWITELAECKETGVQWNGLNTYAGWMCNTDGSGIEIGVFIDEYCRLYARNLQYSSIMEDEDYQYFFQSQDVIPFMFNDIIECRDLDSVQYLDEETYEGMVAAGYSMNNAYGDVSEACQALFYGDFVPRSLNYCGNAKTWSSEELSQMQQAYASGGNQNNQENNYGNGQNMYQYIQAQQMMYNSYGKDASWYTYDLSALDVLDGASTCERVKTKWEYYGYVTAAGVEANTSGISNVYTAQNTTGSFWKWVSGSGSSSSSNGASSSAASTSESSRLFPTRNNKSSFQTADKKLSPLEIAWIVLASVVVTASFMHVTRKQILKRKLKKQEPEKEVYVRTDDKGNPLIIS